MWVGTKFYSAQGLQIKAEAWKITCKYCKYVTVRFFPRPSLGLQITCIDGPTPILLHRKNNCDVQLAKQDTNKK